MPAVSRPSEQAKINVVALAIDSPSPSRRVINLAFLVVCLSLMVAYYFKFTSWDRSLLTRHLTGPQHPAGQRENLKRNLSGQSRGISTTKSAMPTNQSSKTDRRKGSKKARPRHADNSTYWPQHESDAVRDGSPSGAPAEEMMPLRFASRPPPPPPMTPLVIETGPFHFQERRHSEAVSISGDAATPFYQQQNPDYSAASSTSSTTAPVFQGYPTSSQRVSYTHTLSFGSPRDVSSAELDASMPSFTPHSFPSSNPMLPPPPHDSFAQDEVEVHGEIISVTDDAGMGWKRHTRVYGGGVCLACQASGGEEGGFYGPNVPLEDRRY
ncbi:hypothetical protein PG985_011033 [Apiospora marii]|uniref:Uncharacterized protein n=1 Tax=Apiospora marii TaxID=335849 RepID=A0ABR1SSI2_9PEZI